MRVLRIFLFSALLFQAGCSHVPRCEPVPPDAAVELKQYKFSKQRVTWTTGPLGGARDPRIGASTVSAGLLPLYFESCGDVTIARRFRQAQRDMSFGRGLVWIPSVGLMFAGAAGLTADRNSSCGQYYVYSMAAGAGLFFIGRYILHRRERLRLLPICTDFNRNMARTFQLQIQPDPGGVVVRADIQY